MADRGSASPMAALGLESASGSPITVGLADAQSAEMLADSALLDQRRSAATLESAAFAGRQLTALAAARSKQRAALTAAYARRWVMPVLGARFTSPFGPRWGRMHEGDDLACPTGTPIYAMSTGVVTYVGWWGGGGNTTQIRYWDGTVAYYAHQSDVEVSVGQSVSPGQVVGLVGSTGDATGPHLHLEIHPDGGRPIDPRPWMAAHGLVY